MVSVKIVRLGVSEIRSIYRKVYETINPVRLRKFVKRMVTLQDKRVNSKIISYIRIFSHLNTATSIWSKKKREKGLHFLRLVKNLTSDCPFREEELYYRKINEIMSNMLSESTCNICNSHSCRHVKPQRIKTKIKLAQNICILRILKVHA